MKTKQTKKEDIKTKGKLDLDKVILQLMDSNIFWQSKWFDDCNEAYRRGYKKGKRMMDFLTERENKRGYEKGYEKGNEEGYKEGVAVNKITKII